MANAETEKPIADSATVKAEEGCPTVPVSRYHLVLFQTEQQDEIDRSTVRDIRQRLDQVVTTPPDRTEIDIWVESPGGDAHAAYKLNLELRSRTRYVRAIVPDYAKSAATLLVLGCDEIFMAPAAELGPLDVQIEHPSREDVTVSGLDVAGSFEFVGQTAVQLILAGGGSVIRQTGLARAEVLRSMTGFCASFLEPAVSKLDPHLVHRAASQLRVAEHYARTMLKTRKNPEKASDESIRRLIRRLVSEYPAHGFVISRSEAKSLGLPVRPSEEHPRWRDMKALHERAEEAGSLIALFPDAGVDEGDQDVTKSNENGAEMDVEGRGPNARKHDGSEVHAGNEPASN